MIAPLRRRHRAIFVLLAVLIPLLLVLALGARRTVPLTESLPPGLTAGASGAPEAAD